MAIDKKSLEHYKKLKVPPNKGYIAVDGVPNKSADEVERVDRCWSDTNLDSDYAGIGKQPFDRLKCQYCGSTRFEVLLTGSYEATARCNCGVYYIVHCG